MSDGHDGHIEETTWLGGSWTAGCSCGWEDPTENTEQMAVLSLQAHYENVASDE